MQHVRSLNTSVPATGLPVANQPRYLGIDALRGLACVAVVLFHMKEGGHIDLLLAAAPRWLSIVLSHGDSGVAVFFVISGFVIANSMLRETVTGSYVARFLLRRSLRLDPPYWAAIALTTISSYFSAHLLADRIFVPPSWFELFLHLTYLVELAGQRAISTVFWTLCIEIQFYVSFALLMWLVSRLSREIGREYALNLVLLPCTVLAAFWLTPAVPFRIHGLFVEHWYLFLAGVWLWRAVDDRHCRFSLIVVLVNFAILIALSWLAGRFSDLVGLYVAVFLLWFGRSGRLKKYGGGPLLQWLGLISYSLYLTHTTVTGASFRLAGLFTAANAMNETILLVLVTSLCCLFAWMFYLLFERFGLRVSKLVVLHREPTLHANVRAHHGMQP